MTNRIDLYGARRDLQLFRYASYVGGDAYRYPPRTTLSSQRLSYSVTTTRGDVESGLTYQEETRADGRISYLVPHPAETPASYDLRRAIASYVNPVSLIVDAYAKSVTAETARSAPIEYLDDVDLRGTSWANFVETIARWACVYGEVAIVVDAPSEDEDLHPYCCLVHPTAWAWTRVDRYGRVTEFAYVTEATEPDETAGTWTVSVVIWSTEGWQEIEYDLPAGVALSPSADGKVLRSGPLPDGLDGKIPVTIVYASRDDSTLAPRGISLIGDAADVGRTIYNRRSWSDEITRKAGFPTLAIPSGDTGGQLADSTRLAIGTDKALGYNATTGTPSWIQPSAEWVKEIREQNVHDFSMALRQAGVDGSGASGASASGEALRVRSRDFESTAASLAKRLQAAEVEILRRLSVLSGQDPDEVRVTYPSRFVLPDLSADFDRAMRLLKDSPIEIGVTAKKAAAVRLVQSALSLDPDTAQIVSDEIERVLSEDTELYQARRAKELTETTDGRRSKGDSATSARGEQVSESDGDRAEQDDEQDGPESNH